VDRGGERWSVKRLTEGGRGLVVDHWKWRVFVGSKEWRVRAMTESSSCVEANSALGADSFEWIDSLEERVVRGQVGTGGDDPAAWQAAKCE
jgi:hypothetical protein